MIGDKLKIVMTADTIGGVWTYVMELCKVLTSQNIEVHLLTMGKPLNEAQKSQVEQLDTIFLYQKKYKLEWMQNPWEDVEAANSWINELYLEIKPDIVHLNNYMTIPSHGKCPVVTVFHSCVLSWHQGVKKSYSPQEWNKYKKTVEQALSRSDVVVFPSDAIKRIAQNIYHRIAHPVVIYNGANIKIKGPSQKKPFVLSGGRLWDEAKNIQVLSSIAPKLSWPVKIAGNIQSPDGQVFHSGTVELLGQLSHIEMQHTMEEASIFVMPAKYEPFGLSVLEAASAGCALALSNISTYQELWGDAALYFDPFDEADAANKIETLIKNPSLRDELSEKAKERAQLYTAETMADKYIKLYDKLLKEQLEQKLA